MISERKTDKTSTVLSPTAGPKETIMDTAIKKRTEEPNAFLFAVWPRRFVFFPQSKEERNDETTSTTDHSKHLPFLHSPSALATSLPLSVSFFPFLSAFPADRQTVHSAIDRATEQAGQL